MVTLPALDAQITQLEARAAEIRSQGECLQGVRLERSPSGGTASKAAQSVAKYARLRAGKGGVLPNGKKSQYIPLAQVGHCEAAIARGRELSKVERQLKQAQAQRDRLVGQAKSLGLLGVAELKW